MERLTDSTEFKKLYLLQAAEGVGGGQVWVLQGVGPWRLTRLVGDLGYAGVVVVTDGTRVYAWGPGLRLEV